MAKPLARIEAAASPSVDLPNPNLRHEPLSRPAISLQESRDSFLDSWPCITYVCNSSLDLSFVTENITELIEVSREDLIGNHAIWKKIILPEELGAVLDKLRETERCGAVSFVHRVVDKRGLPVWVCHSARWTLSKGAGSVDGCIMPMRSHEHVTLLEPTTISRFVHKMGNHFQLLNLILNSLRKGFSPSQNQEVDALEETIEKAIQLTRAFSEYSQNPTWVSAVDVAEILDTAAVARGSLFIEKGIALTRKIDPALRGLMIEGDPYLLELAIGEVLQNALEATDRGGEVVIDARPECFDGKPCAAKLSVIDYGLGIDSDDLASVKIPFFSTKQKHIGLGLSMATRFIELHGGTIRVISSVKKGTEVQITLPVNERRDDSCR